MITYNTITEAFRNGQGDVFFTKDSKFVCFSRHDDNSEDMTAQGFTRLTYPEVVNLAAAQMPEVIKPTPVTEVKAKTFIHIGFNNFTNGFYDEFPDAYNNGL